MPTADGTRFLINTSYTGLGTGSLAVVLDWAAVAPHRRSPPGRQPLADDIGFPCAFSLPRAPISLLLVPAEISRLRL